MGFWNRFKSNRPGHLEAVAHELGFQFQAKDEFGLFNMVRDFQITKMGTSRKAKNIFVSKDETSGVQKYVFDYLYTVSKGKSSVTYKQSIYFAYSKSLGLPQFVLKPQSLLHRIGHLVGKRDIDYIDYPTFSKNYYLVGEDWDLIRHTFSDQILRFFDDRQGWSVEGLNYFLIFYRKHKMYKPHELRHFVHLGDEIFDLFKGRGFNV